MPVRDAREVWRPTPLRPGLHRWDDAERHFEHAVAMNDRLGARPAGVRTRRAYAAMLLDRNAPGDQPRAAALITAALAETAPLDMPAEAVKLERLRERAAGPP